MELVIPWISYWVCHHFGMSINRFWSCDLLWSSNDIKYQMMLCDESFPLDPFWSRSEDPEDSCHFLTFIFKFLFWKFKCGNDTGLQAQIIGRGHAQFFLVLDRGPWRLVSFLHFHFQFFFWKMTWHFGYTLNIGDINIWRHLLKSISI